MSDARVNNISGHVAGCLCGILLVAGGWLSPFVSRRTGINAHDLQGICLLGLMLGTLLGGRILGFRSRRHGALMGSLLLLVFTALWPLLGSRTHVQEYADVVRHLPWALMCVIVSAAAGIAVMWTLRAVRNRLRAQLALLCCVAWYTDT